MAKYVYPAVFSPEDDGYSVDFPDIPHCYTCGNDILHAIEMAKDVLALRLCDMENANEKIAEPSDIRNIKIDRNDFISMVDCDTIQYRKIINCRAVKKTLTIPSWLNEMAEKADINFSGLLQEALKQKLHIND